MFDILFLGTGASVPSRTRALPCVAVRRGADVILFDCGEGSQRQLMISPFSFMKIRAIFVTHMHGDHFYGLPGLLQTMGMMGRKDPLIACGPEGFSEALRTCLDVCEGDIDFPLDLRDVVPGEIVNVSDLTVVPFETDHGLPSLGYVLREADIRGKIDAEKASFMGISGKDFSDLEAGDTVDGVTLSDVSSSFKKGASVAYTGDTKPCGTVDEAVKGVDVLIHESTYLESERSLADDHMHSTALSAAETAKRCGCGTLFLVHISNRYKDRAVLLKEASAVFENTYVPEDLAHYTMTKSGFRSV